MEKHKRSVSIYAEGRRNKNIKLYMEAINALQDGEKITVKRIAGYMGLSTKQVSRYRNDKRYEELMNGFQKICDEYNNGIKKNNKQ